MFETIPLYLYALMVLLILYGSMFVHRERENYGSRLFRSIIAANMAVLAVDFIQVSVNAIDQPILRIVNHLFSVLIYILGTLLPLLWYRYVDYAIHKDRAHIDKFKIWLFVPFAVNAVLAVLSPWFGWLFVIDAANEYSRGSLFLVNAAIQYGYLIAATIAIVKNRDSLRKANYWPTLLFIVPPVVGGAIQILYYGLLLVWPMVTISVLMVFVFVQFERANTDYLTGLYNRREYESYLHGLERRKKKVGILAGVILDLDRFKSINDLFGHEMGDLALQQMADTIREAFSPGDFIARIGGDEFAVLYFVEKESQAVYPVEKLKDALAAFNKSRLFDFDLELSIGAAVFQPEQDESIVKFIKRLDDLMYQTKAASAQKRVR